jgi:hypothetical protein
MSVRYFQRFIGRSAVTGSSPSQTLILFKIAFAGSQALVVVSPNAAGCTLTQVQVSSDSEPPESHCPIAPSRPPGQHTPPVRQRPERDAGNGTRGRVRSPGLRVSEAVAERVLI